MGIEGPNKSNFSGKIKKLANIVAVGAALSNSASALTEKAAQEKYEREFKMAEVYKKLPESKNVVDLRNGDMPEIIPISVRGLDNTVGEGKWDQKRKKMVYGPYDRDIEATVKRMDEEHRKKVATDEKLRKADTKTMAELTKLEEQAAREYTGNPETNNWRKKK